MQKSCSAPYALIRSDFNVSANNATITPKGLYQSGTNSDPTEDVAEGRSEVGASIVNERGDRTYIN
jgi:hypothetical protein